MGVTLSTHSTLAPISLASTIIGFVSFSFTVATFLRVFWDNVTTVMQANDQVHDQLTNLRVQLYEEKQSLRKLRRYNKDWGRTRRAKGTAALPLDDMTIRSMQDTLRRLTKRFKALERRFIDRDTTAGRKRYRESSSPSPPQRSSSQKGIWDAEKGVRLRERDVVTDDEDPRGLPQDDHAYCDITLGKRIVWLRHRGEAMDLLEGVSRLQTRRIARQVGEISVVLHNYGNTIDGLDDGMLDIEARLNRVVGVRRVGG